MHSYDIQNDAVRIHDEIFGDAVNTVEAELATFS